jgi:hypothetical protein
MTDLALKGNENFAGLMAVIVPIVTTEREEGRITDSTYSSVFLGAMQTAMQLSYSAEVQQAQKDAIVSDTTIKQTQATIDNNIKNYNLSNLLPAQLGSINADTALKQEQKAQLAQSVIDNRKIKSIDALGNTSGLAMNANVTVPANLWGAYFGILNDLNTSTYATP